MLYKNCYLGKVVIPLIRVKNYNLVRLIVMNYYEKYDIKIKTIIDNNKTLKAF